MNNDDRSIWFALSPWLLAIILCVVGLWRSANANYPTFRTLEIPVEGYYLCRDSTCIELPPGAYVRIPVNIPPGPWDTFTAKKRI